MPEGLSYIPPEAIEPAKPKPTVAIVEISEKEGVMHQARDVAERKLDQELESATGIKKIFLEIWKGSIFRELYLTKGVNAERKTILEPDKQNIYAGDVDDRSAHQAAMAATTDRFMSEYDEMIHSAAGEVKGSLGESGEEIVLKSAIQELVRDYAAGFIDESAFDKRQSAIFGGAKTVRKDIIENGSLYASNLKEIAKQEQMAVEHGQKLQELDLDYQVILGKAKTGVRTEAQHTAVDLIIEKMLQTGVGKYVNEYTLTSALSLAYCAAVKINTDIASSKLAALGTLGVSTLFSAFVGGAKEGRMMQEKRKQNSRDRAKGRNLDSSPLEKELAEFQYDTAKAVDLARNLEQSVYNISEGNYQPRELSIGEFQLAVSNLAEIESRTQISDSQKVDLITYSDTTQVEQERLRLNITRIKAKEILRDTLLEKKDEFAQAGIENFDQYLEKMSGIVSAELIDGNSGMEKKNALFDKMKRGKVASATIRGFFAGLLVGGFAQQILPKIGELKPLEHLKHYLEGLPMAIGAVADVVSEQVIGAGTEFVGDKVKENLRYENT